MVKVSLSVDFYVDTRSIGDEYSNEDYLIYEIKEQVTHGLYRFDSTEIKFNNIDIEEV